MYLIKICGCNTEPVIHKDALGVKKYKKHEHTPILNFERDTLQDDLSIYLSVLTDKYYRWGYIYKKGARVPLMYFSDSTIKQK